MTSNLQTKLPLLQIVVKKQINSIHRETNEDVEQENINGEEPSGIVEKMLEENTNATIYSIADDVVKKNSGVIAECVDSDVNECTGIIKKINNPAPNIKINVNNSITLEDLPSSKVKNIKRIIYDLHHKGGGVEPDEPDKEAKPSFLDEFYDVESMFDWLNEQDSSITEKTGISRSQLIELTKNDDWEDSHYDFFGTINRIFNMLDADSDSVLTSDEIKMLIGEELGESFESYKAKVDAYADELQSYYESLDEQGKLEFALDRTEEYLEAAGLTDQLQALERLTEEGVDLHSDIKVGNISLSDLNPGFQGVIGESYRAGSYISAAMISDYNGAKIKNYVYDYDTSDVDHGIVLDIRLLNGAWQVFVAVLVHELTHATSYLYSSYEETTPGRAAWNSEKDEYLIDKLYEKGVMSLSEYNYYKENINSLSSEDYLRLQYFTSAVKGEYAAYQVGADYCDSMAEDLYKSGIKMGDGWFDLPGMTEGPNEKAEIIEHINVAYPTEAVPDWKWWSYA